MNSVNLFGRLTKDPSTGRTKKDTNFVAFKLAVKKKPIAKYKTEYIQCVAYGAAADIALNLKKGERVLINGSIAGIGTKYMQDGSPFTEYGVTIETLTLIEGRNKTETKKEEPSIPIDDDDIFPF